VILIALTALTAAESVAVPADVLMPRDRPCPVARQERGRPARRAAWPSHRRAHGDAIGWVSLDRCRAPDHVVPSIRLTEKAEATHQSNG
jgi:hypothetical protein